MALNEVLGLLLPVASTCLAWPHPRQASGAAVALQCQSVAAGSVPGPASLRLTSPWRRSKQNLNTDDKLKAYLTDIMQINARSLVLRKLEIWNQNCRSPPCPWAAAVPTFIGRSIPREALAKTSERTERHCGVQTIWQGRGSRGRSSGWGWDMASATRRRSGRSHRARQAISYVLAMSYDHIVGNTVCRIYLTLRQS